MSLSKPSPIQQVAGAMKKGKHNSEEFVRYFARLSTTCTVFRDMFITGEMKEKNNKIRKLETKVNALQLRVFWGKYKVQKLRTVIHLFGQNENHQDEYICECLRCCDLHNLNARTRELDVECQLYPYFAKIAKRHGLTIYNPQTGGQERPKPLFEGAPDFIDSEDDLVFVVPNSWTSLCYGRRLWGESKFGAPKLLALKKLFVDLKEETPFDYSDEYTTDSFITDGEDYPEEESEEDTEPLHYEEPDPHSGYTSPAF
jgi:hypothetical protein